MWVLYFPFVPIPGIPNYEGELRVVARFVEENVIYKTMEELSNIKTRKLCKASIF